MLVAIWREAKITHLRLSTEQIDEKETNGVGIRCREDSRIFGNKPRTGPENVTEQFEPWSGDLEDKRKPSGFARCA